MQETRPILGRHLCSCFAPYAIVGRQPSDEPSSPDASAGALVADFIHVSPVLGPIMGIAAGVLIAIDPGRIIWTKQDKTQTQSRLNPEPN